MNRIAFLMIIHQGVSQRPHPAAVADVKCLLFTELAPASTEPLVLGSFYLSKGGLNFPIPIWATGHAWAAWGLLVGLVLAWWQRQRFRDSHF